MLTSDSGTARGIRSAHDVSRAAELLTSRLTEAGLASRTHDDGYGQGPQVTVLSAADARSLLTIGHNGIIQWHYEPRTGPVTEPAAITKLVLHLLGAPARRPPATTPHSRSRARPDGNCKMPDWPSPCWWTKTSNPST
jgi:hypothetical protein